MSNISEPLTALQLYEIRAQLRQSAVAMAGLLGINSNTYYHYERTGKIPRPVSVAARFLSTQTHLAEKPTLKSRTIAKFKAQFLPGARFGRLRVVNHASSPTGSRKPHVQVRCDCGKEVTLPIHDLELMTQCGPTCKVRSPAPPLVIATSPPPDLDDPDRPEIDEPDVVWRIYNDRKERELQAALDELNGTIAPCDDQTPIDAVGVWEEGL